MMNGATQALEIAVVLGESDVGLANLRRIATRTKQVVIGEFVAQLRIGGSLLTMFMMLATGASLSRRHG